MHTTRLASIVLVLALGACNGGGSSPTAPTASIPSLAGQWTGTFTVASCNETGFAIGSGFCANLERGGGLTFTPSQSGGNVSGPLGLGSLSIPVSGNIGPDGVLFLAGSGAVNGGTVTLNNWRFTVSGSSMSGQFTFTAIPPGGPTTGTGTVSASGVMAR